MKQCSINGDTVVVGVFVIKIFNREDVKYYIEVKQQSDIIPLHTGRPDSKSLHRRKNGFKHGLYPFKSFYQRSTRQIVFYVHQKMMKPVQNLQVFVHIKAEQISIFRSTMDHITTGM